MWKALKEKHDVLTLFIALLAVVFSQLPPLYTLFESEEISFNELSSLSIVPSLFDGAIIAHNSSMVNLGEKVGVVRSLRFYVYDGNNKMLIHQSATSTRSEDKNFTGQFKFEEYKYIDLQPLQTKNTGFMYSGHLSANDMETSKQLQDRFFSEQAHFRGELNDTTKSWSDMKISERLSSDTINYIEGKSSWIQPGKIYFLHIIDLGDRKIETAYEANISQSDVRVLRDFVSQIAGSNSIHPSGMINISLSKIPRSKILRNPESDDFHEDNMATNEAIEIINSQPRNIEAINVIE